MLNSEMGLRAGDLRWHELVDRRQQIAADAHVAPNTRSKGASNLRRSKVFSDSSYTSDHTLLESPSTKVST